MAAPMLLKIYPTVIASGASLSGGVSIGGNTLAGIAVYSGWLAAGLSFAVSPDGGTTWLELQSTAASVAYTVAASQFVQFDPAAWLGINTIKVRSGTAGSPVVQTNGAKIDLITRPMP
jgi:hypothetical protein